MYATGNKKMLNMLILEILRKYSDEKHPLTQQQIIKLLKQNNGMECDRRSVKNNIEHLVELGYEISMDKGYYLISREFDDAELRILIDSVLFSKSISTKQGQERDGVAGVDGVAEDDALAGFDGAAGDHGQTEDVDSPDVGVHVGDGFGVAGADLHLVRGGADFEGGAGGEHGSGDDAGGESGEFFHHDEKSLLLKCEYRLFSGWFP